jgi:hypothetical protein
VQAEKKGPEKLLIKISYRPDLEFLKVTKNRYLSPLKKP